MFPVPVLALLTALAPAAQEPARDTPSEEGGPTHLGRWLRTIHGLDAPQAVAFGPDGRLHVAEAGADRVRAFDLDGREVAVYAGQGTERLRAPQGVSVAPDGTVLVSDTGNHRVVAFRPDGSVLRAFGGLGAGPGSLHTPLDLDTDGEVVAVAEAGNRRVQRFDLTGRPLGSTPASGPADVALAGESWLFADAALHRIEHRDAAGEPAAVLGEYGFFPGTFARPSGLEVHAGRVFVADQENHRVQVFLLDALAGERGVPALASPLYVVGVHAVRPREGKGRLHYPADVAVSADGALAAVCEPWDDRVQLFGRAPGAEPPPDVTRAGTPQASPHLGPTLAADGTCMASVEPETAEVIVYDLRQLDGERRNDPIRISRFGGRGERLGLFARPAGMDLDLESRSLVVCDPALRRVHEILLDYDPTGEVGQDFEMARAARMLDFERIGPGGERAWPIEPIAAARTGGELFVLDAANEMVHVLDAGWRLQKSFGGHGTAPGALRAPTDLAASPDGERLYVVDSGNRRVQAFSPRGEPLAVLGDGELDEPFGVACAPDGTVVVSDAGAHQLVRFAADGTLLGRSGSRGIRRGELYRPRGLAFSGAGELYVVDHANHRGIVLTVDGEYVDAFGSRLYTRPAEDPASYRAEDYTE